MNINAIKDKIKSANKILILPSQPADLDCLTSALSINWYVKTIFKKEDVRIYSFFQIPEKLVIFDDINQIEQKYLDNIDISVYDLIIGVDGNGFDRYLTNSYQKFVSQESLVNKFINIDHHQPDINSQFDSDLNISDPSASSTTLVIFRDLFKDIEITKEVATWLYTGILSDSGNFRWNINAETLSVASQLLAKGADYLKAGNINIPIKEIDFSVWAISHTQYLTDLRTTVLYIDKTHYQELDSLFGEKWDFKDLDRYYKNSFCKSIEGFDYYLILKEDKKADNVRVTWRMRDLPVKPINFVRIMQDLGFDAGGHLNSASGRAYGKKISEVWEKLKAKLEQEIL